MVCSWLVRESWTLLIYQPKCLGFGIWVRKRSAMNIYSVDISDNEASQGSEDFLIFFIWNQRKRVPVLKEFFSDHFFVSHKKFAVLFLELWYWKRKIVEHARIRGALDPKDLCLSFIVLVLLFGLFIFSLLQIIGIFDFWLYRSGEINKHLIRTACKVGVDLLSFRINCSQCPFKERNKEVYSE